MKKLFFPFLLVVFANTLFGQPTNSLSFTNITVNEGLSQNYVHCIFQDSRGFMWFGSAEDGLNKYDGYKFTIYRGNDNARFALSSNQVRSIAEDSQGYLWIGTRNGLNKFDRKKEQFTTYKNIPDELSSLSGNSLNVVYIDRADNLWVGTDNNGLNLFDKQTAQCKRYLNGKTVKNVYEDRQGNLWIATTNSGLYLFDREFETFENFSYTEDLNGSISSNNVSSIFEDSKNNLWVGTRDAGLNIFDRKTKRFKCSPKDDSIEKSSPANRILSLGEDLWGRIWIGTENGGLRIYNPDNQSYENQIYDPCNNNSIRSNSIYSIFRDSKGNMWLGTATGGLSLYNSEGNKFTSIKPAASGMGLNNNVVFGITEDSKGNLLIGTDGGGLNFYNKETGQFSYFIHEEGNPNTICGNNVLSVLEDSYQNIWIGTWGQGVTMYNRETKLWKHFKNIPSDTTSLSGNNAWTIFEDRERNIWIGTYWGGLSLFNRNKESFTQFKKDEKRPGSLNSININKIYEDKLGNLWFGTYDGLSLLNKKKRTFQHYLNDPDDPSSISSNIVTSIHEDEKGNLWLGTFKGLNYFDRASNSFKAFTKKDGFPNDIIKAILEDDQGNLWISANGGISRFDTKTFSVKNYTVADGLETTQYTPHAYKAKDGTMYFSGIGGLLKLHSGNIKDQLFEPPIVFTDFQIFNESVAISESAKVQTPLENHISETESILLSHNESVFSIEFAALNYTNELKKQYAYMLDGFDKKWNHVGGNRKATYTNLEPGKYEFKVKTLNNGGEWSENIRTLSIYISPPFWKTWWFRSIFIISLIGAALTYYKSRINLIQEQKIVLEKQVEVRTVELREANRELTEQKEEILHQRVKIQELYEDFKDSIRAAETIQKSILPDQEHIKKYLPDFFVFYKPKDIVSGDFYWFTVKDDNIIIAAVDCTGHGVSGALMAINGHYLLNLAVSAMNDINAGEILNKLNQGIIKELHREDYEFSEGMEISLCVIDKKQSIVQFAGANSPLYVCRNEQFVEIKGNKFPVGDAMSSKDKNFTNQLVPVEKNDVLYLFSDGYPDQLGGKDGQEKFMYNRFRTLLKQIAPESSSEKITLLDRNLTEWMGNVEQLDDILVLGFTI